MIKDNMTDILRRRYELMADETQLEWDLLKLYHQKMIRQSFASQITGINIVHIDVNIKDRELSDTSDLDLVLTIES